MDESAHFSATFDDSTLVAFVAEDEAMGTGANVLVLPPDNNPTCPAVAVLTVDSYAVDCAAGWITIDASSSQGSLHIGATVQCLTAGTSSVCFTYNPTALTNACVQVSDQTENVPTPVVGTQPTTEQAPTVTPTTTPLPVCIVGPVCASIPVPGVVLGSEPVTVPFPTVGTQEQPVVVPLPGGYVEITELCPTVGQTLCHVDL